MSERSSSMCVCYSLGRNPSRGLQVLVGEKGSVTVVTVPSSWGEAARHSCGLLREWFQVCFSLSLCAPCYQACPQRPYIERVKGRTQGLGPTTKVYLVCCLPLRRCNALQPIIPLLSHAYALEPLRREHLSVTTHFRNRSLHLGCMDSAPT